MKYLGGKHVIGKAIADFLSRQCVNNNINTYLEPFCGSLGVFKHMVKKNTYKKYIASDIQEDLIQMWREIQDDSLVLPNHITEEEYNRLRQTKSPNALKAVAGFGMSFGGKFFGGYAPKWTGKSGRNFLNEFRHSIEKIKPIIQNKNNNNNSVLFYNKSYLKWKPKNMLIYCDPPYVNTEGYSNGECNIDEFWNTMRKWSRNNCVFISEEHAPKDFIVVWRQKKRRTLSKTKSNSIYEKIYTYRGNKMHTRKIKNITNNSQ
jgi:DNA adenine methylase